MQRLLGAAWEMLALALATGWGIGFCPVMPGTVASLCGPPLVWSIERLHLPRGAVVGIFVAIVLLGIPVCSRAARSLGHHDPSEVVYDEIAAFTVVFCLVPVNLVTGVLGFLWFRLWDITKPWPIRRLERLPRGLGIMIDDLVAGIYAAVALWFTVRLIGLS